jgi:maleate isomerase
MVEPLTAAMLSEAREPATGHFSRFRVTSIGLDDRELAQFRPEAMLPAAALLRDANVDVIAWGGTSGSWLGVGADRELCAQIQSKFHVPATTSTLAILDGLRAYGVKRYGLVTPYLDEVGERLVGVYAAEGFDCSGARNLGMRKNSEFAAVSPDQIRDLVRSVASGSDAVAIVCTNMAGAPLVQGLEQELGIPVIDSLTATVWRSLDLVAPGERLRNWGSLGASGSLRLRFQEMLDELLARTQAGRTTIRLDLPSHGLHVDRVAGESHRSGVRSIRKDGSLDQWAMPTVKWLELHQEPLVQNDFATDPPPVSPALVDVYGVRAQMLGPLVMSRRMVGWISVHEVAGPRRWSPADRQALDEAIRTALDVLETHPGEVDEGVRA